MGCRGGADPYRSPEKMVGEIREDYRSRDEQLAGAFDVFVPVIRSMRIKLRLKLC